MPTECVQKQLNFEAEQRAERRRFDAFLTFHAANPQVYELFVRFAREAKQAGRERFGARLIWERIRWHFTVEQTDATFRANDHCCAFYSRAIMLREPDLAGFFERRDARFGISDAELLDAVNRIDRGRGR